MFKSQQHPELIDLDEDDGPGPSARPWLSRRPPAHPESLQGAVAVGSADHAALRSPQSGASARASKRALRSSLPIPIIDLSGSEAAAGLPSMHRSRPQGEHKDSLGFGKHLSADTGKAASEKAGLGEGGAASVWLGNGDITAQVSHVENMRAASKR